MISSNSLVKTFLVVAAVIGLSFNAVAQPQGPGDRPGQGGERPGGPEERGEGPPREFLDSLPVFNVNETPVEVPVVQEGTLFRFTTNRPGMYRIKTISYPETPVDTVLVLAKPASPEDPTVPGSPAGPPEFIGGNDDFKFNDLTSELNRFLEGDTEYVVSLEPYRERGDDGEPIEDPGFVESPVQVLVEGPISPNVFPSGHLIDWYDFDEDNVEDTGWVHLPGGFGGGPGGEAFLTEWPEGTFLQSEDGGGIAVEIAPGELSLFLGEPVLSHGQPIVIRIHFQSLGRGPQLFLAALRGNALTGEGLNNSLTLNQVFDVGVAVEESRVLELIYRQPSGTFITPLIQIVGGGGETTIGIDRVAIYEMEANGIF